MKDIIRDCLIKAIIDEMTSQSKYEAYAEKAQEEKYYQMASILKTIANNEKEHAERFQELLGDKYGEIKATFNYPISKYTSMNLDYSINLEEGAIEEYQEFEKIAKNYGESEIATAFKEIREVEEFHLKTFKKLRKNILENRVFSRDKVQAWHCRNCGYIHYGLSAPKICPACRESYHYYEILAINY